MRIGLFYGSFNPIHRGHLEIASYFVEYADLEQIWFVVSPQNPLKRDIELLEVENRLELVYAAIGDNEQIKCCEVELGLPKPSFTIDTMKELSKAHPDYEFSIIMGTDNLEKLSLWKNYEEILKNYRIFVYPRTGCTGGLFKDHPSVTIIDSQLLDVSATMLRDQVSKQEFDQWLPSQVAEIIKEKGYYASTK